MDQNGSHTRTVEQAQQWVWSQSLLRLNFWFIIVPVTAIAKQNATSLSLGGEKAPKSGDQGGDPVPENTNRAFASAVGLWEENVATPPFALEVRSERSSKRSSVRP